MATTQQSTFLDQLKKKMRQNKEEAEKYQEEAEEYRKKLQIEIRRREEVSRCLWVIFECRYCSRFSTCLRISMGWPTVMDTEQKASVRLRPRVIKNRKKPARMNSIQAA